MSEIIVARFPDASSAKAARDALARMGQTYQIEPEDIEVVRRKADDDVEIMPELNIRLAHVIGGAIWGAVLGLVFLIPVLGAAFGSAVGYITGRFSDVGIKNSYLEDVGREIEPGEAAVALLARRVDPGALAETIRRFGGQVMRSSLSGRRADQIRTVTAGDATGAEKADLRDQPKLA